MTYFWPDDAFYLYDLTESTLEAAERSGAGLERKHAERPVQDARRADLVPLGFTQATG